MNGRDSDHERILLVSPFFDPEPISTGRYNTYLARGLRERGHQVEVVCSHPFYPAWRPRPGADEVDGIPLHRGGGAVRYPNNGVLRRATLEYWFARHAGRSLRNIQHRFDRMVCVIPPSLFLATAPGRQLGMRIVGIVHDLQGIHAGKTQGRAGRLVAGLADRLDARALRRCDRVICLSHSMADYATRRLHLNDVVVRYPFVTLAEGAEDALDSLFLPGQRHVVYAGALGAKQDPEFLLQVFRELTRSHADVDCHFFSEGPSFERIRALLATGKGAPRIFTHPLVEDADTWALYRRPDVHLVPQGPGLGAGSLPSKLPNLLHAGTPVLAICDADCELATVVREAGAGAVVDSRDPGAVADGVLALMRQSREIHGRSAAWASENCSLDALLDSVLERNTGLGRQ
ncbi:MAG: glycosyltransferase family 4 protein [Gammaproteobacteria bacterium]|nr:glycosyltransferase family 4 protein [Gammaproteobacteria bacterium]